MAFRPTQPPEAATPEWEPSGLPENTSTVERHRDRDEYRVRPGALADALAAWEADDDDTEDG